MGQKRQKKIKGLRTGVVYVLYKIGCPYSYVGSTLRFKDRQKEHHSRCNNENCKEWFFPVYQFIRNNGGFDEWEFKVIETGLFNSRRELKIRERYYQDLYWDNLLNTVRGGK